MLGSREVAAQLWEPCEGWRAADGTRRDAKIRDQDAGDPSDSIASRHLSLEDK